MTGWADLVDELDRWQDARRIATLWWRDDDAVAPSLPLERLLSIAGKIPVALAVIPAAVEPPLATWLSDRPGSAQIAVLQHGWRHLNHSGVGNKRSEFPPHRQHRDIVVDLISGRAQLIELFESRALSVLVPPWNRFDESLIWLLGGCGLSGLSRAQPRRAAPLADAVIEANVHIDLVAWASGRGFIGEGAALGGLVRHLQARRLALVCSEEPTGILTHHLVQDEATDAFLYRVLAVTTAHPAACWLNAADVFAPPWFASSS